MLSKKPLIFTFRKLSPAKLVSVKDVEKELRVDIAGTWLYKLNAIPGERINVYFRARYMPGVIGSTQQKETIENLLNSLDPKHVDKFFTNLGADYQIDLNYLLKNVLFSFIKRMPNGEKMYVIKFVAKDFKTEDVEGYIVFQT